MSIAENAPLAPVIDEEEAARARSERIYRIAKWTLPSLVMVLSLLAWHLYVTINEIPHYILPGPLVGRKVDHFGLGTSVACPADNFAFDASCAAVAVIGGVGLAVAFTQSKWVEMSLFPLRSDPAGDTRRRHRAADLQSMSTAPLSPRCYVPGSSRSSRSCPTPRSA